MKTLRSTPFAASAHASMRSLTCGNPSGFSCSGTGPIPSSPLEYDEYPTNIPFTSSICGIPDFPKASTSFKYRLWNSGCAGSMGFIRSPFPSGFSSTGTLYLNSHSGAKRVAAVWILMTLPYPFSAAAFIMSLRGWKS